MKAEVEQEIRWIEAAKKDPEAFEHLFYKYYDPIYNYILRRVCNISIAEDVAANTFLKALDHIQDFKWKGVSLVAWLYRIATNEINLNYRKTKRLVRLTDEHLYKIKGDESSDGPLLNGEEEVEKSKTNRDIHKVIGSLKLKYQTVITLRYFESLSIKEIAVILDLPENTVKTHIRRGLQKIKEKL